MRIKTAVLTGALMLFMLAACGKKEEAPSLPEESTKSDRIASSAQEEPKETEGVSVDMENGQVEEYQNSHTGAPADGEKTNLSGTVPEELEYIPAEYMSPSEHPGTLERLTYQTWESFSYEEQTQELTKGAWVYLPYGYSEGQKYNVFYLSHGGWSNETTVMGTDRNPRSFKHVIDHAIEDGKIQPLIIVLPTYNNTSSGDSGDYSLALRLTDRFHNELVNDLIPAVEGKYSTYAEDTTREGLKASRDHRGFGGFSMGSVNTWCTFRYALDYFRYFMPMSGSYSTDGEYMAELVRESGHDSDDFFIFAASGTDDFAYSAFKSQIMAMGNVPDGTFRFADNEADGNLSFLEREGYVHDATASDEYTYNGLRFFWNGAR
nr:alpha/beta hydrolase-fold protein [uncultured Acetatifactor sp.]